MVRSRFGEMCSCCFLTALPGPALVHFMHLCTRRCESATPLNGNVQVYEEIPSEYETVVEQSDLRQRRFHGSARLEVREEGAPSTLTRSSSLSLSSGGHRSTTGRAAERVEPQWEDSEV